jgi:hypothetical protein
MHMKSWVLAAGLLAAAAVPAAWAADVGEDDLPPPKGGPQGFYKKSPPPGGPPPWFDDEDDDDGPGAPPPPGRKYAQPPPPAKKYSDAPPPYGPKCVRSEQVREHLTSLGWSDFHEGQKQGSDLVTLRARRPSGRLFELTLHRCSGQLVDAAPLEPRRFGSYAYKAPFEQPYYYDGPRRRPYYYRYHEYDGPGDDRPYRRWYGYRY